MVSGQRRKLNSEREPARVVDGKKAGFNEVHATSFFGSSACDSSNCYRDCTVHTAPLLMRSYDKTG